MNPFFSKYNTPHGTVPFDQIKLEHYEPAIVEGMARQKAEIDAIINNPDEPTFANTVEPYELSGEMLERTTTVFGNQLSANTCDELQELANKLMPMLSEHENDISLNEQLYARIKKVYDNRANEQLNAEQQKLLEDIYIGFTRNGANLNDEQKATFREITKQLSLLSLQFSNNLLKETNDYQMHLTDKADLKGLPESAIEAARETAEEKGLEGWVFTLKAPSYSPFMTYAANRELRQQLYMAYNTRCTHDNAQNNMEVVKQLANLRMQVAQLLGYKTYADYALERRMALDQTHVYRLLNDLLDAYTPTAHKEIEEVQTLAQELEGNDFKLMPWDLGYYSHKLKERKFNLDNEKLRPYFELSNVKKGVFGLATRLYGITFKENKDIPVYHPDVNAYEVFDKDGSFLY